MQINNELSSVAVKARSILVKEEREEKDVEVQCEEKYERRDRIETKERSYESSWYDEEIKEFVEPFYIWFKGTSNRYSNNFDAVLMEDNKNRIALIGGETESTLGLSVNVHI